MDEELKIGSILPRRKYCGDKLLSSDERKALNKKLAKRRQNRRPCAKCHWLRRQREFGRRRRSKIRDTVCIYCRQEERKQASKDKAVERSRNKPDRALVNPISYAPILLKRTPAPARRDAAAKNSAYQSKIIVDTHRVT